ncbi:hypothetical protein pb186bvf_001686 [Paramecium bursaria]
MFRLGVLCETSNYQAQSTNGQGTIKLRKTFATGLSPKNSDLCQIQNDQITIIQYLQNDDFKKLFITTIDRQFNIKQTGFDISNDQNITSFKNIFVVYDKQVKLVTRQGQFYQKTFFKHQYIKKATNYRGSIIPLTFLKKFIYLCSSKLKIIRKITHNKTIYDVPEIGQKVLLHTHQPMKNSFEMVQVDFFSMDRQEITLPTRASKHYSQKNSLFCIEKFGSYGSQKLVEYDWKGAKLSEKNVYKFFSSMNNFSVMQQYGVITIIVDDTTYEFKTDIIIDEDLVEVVNFRNSQGEYLFIFRYREYDQIYQFYQYL